MTHSPVRDMGPLGSDDPPEPSDAAALHIMLLPDDQSCAPAGERDSADEPGCPHRECDTPASTPSDSPRSGSGGPVPGTVSRKDHSPR